MLLLKVTKPSSSLMRLRHIFRVNYFPSSKVTKMMYKAIRNQSNPSKSQTHPRKETIQQPSKWNHNWLIYKIRLPNGRMESKNSYKILMILKKLLKPWVSLLIIIWLSLKSSVRKLISYLRKQMNWALNWINSLLKLIRHLKTLNLCFNLKTKIRSRCFKLRYQPLNPNAQNSSSSFMEEPLSLLIRLKVWMISGLLKSNKVHRKNWVNSNSVSKMTLKSLKRSKNWLSSRSNSLGSLRLHSKYLVILLKKMPKISENSKSSLRTKTLI